MRRRDCLAYAACSALPSISATSAHAADTFGPRPLYEKLAAGPQLKREFDGGTLNIVFAPEVPAGQHAALLEWITNASAAISAYYGRFPVLEAGLLIEPRPGRRIGPGVSFGAPNGYSGSAIRIHVGHDADAAAFADDWVLAHEFVHLGFPTVPRRHLWIEEGSATYVEPIARAMLGQLTDVAVWRQFRRSLPLGQPASDDQGFDRTPSWGRTYWGGAMFCLLADVQARTRTDNKRGLVDALRAIARASGGNSTRWSLDRTLRVGDEAIGAPVLTELHAQHGARSITVDLDALFTSLGVIDAADNGGVSFDERAPLSAVRRAITARPR